MLHICFCHCSFVNIPQRQTAPLLQHQRIFRSPTLSPRGLPTYAEELAIEFVNESLDSSPYHTLRCNRYYKRVVCYLDLSASESDDIET